MKEALSGLRAWLVQRFTAVYMLFFCAFAFFHFAFDAPHSYIAWRGWMAGMPVLIATALFFTALLLHAWVGLRDVILDYVKPLPLRLGVLAALGFVLIGLALWMLKILLLTQH